MGWLQRAGRYELIDDSKDGEELLPLSHGNGAAAHAAAKVKKNDDMSEGGSGFFKVSNYREEKLPYFVKMSLHLATCFFVIVNVIASTKYLSFKLWLYYKELPQTVTSPWLFVLLACELVYWFCSILSAIDTVIPPSCRPKRVLLNIDDPSDCPTVDFLFPCSKEPPEIPLEAVRAGLAMDYPADRFRILVLDDGGQDELKAAVEALQSESGYGKQLRYLRRTKLPGVPHHFKCGNLNYGLEHSESEYIVIVDADMILHPTFLRRSLPYLVKSPNVAFTQIPQSFYNIPPGDPLSDSGLFFYEKMLVRRDAIDTANCVGTGAVFRRKHLDSIGGFQSHSITEDTNTSFILLSKGYTSVYIHEVLQIGLVPWTFEGFLKQRIRWANGAIHQIATWPVILFGPFTRLNWVQKVLIFWHTAFYFMSITNVLLLAVLYAALAFALNLTVGTLDENRQLMSYLAIALLAQRLAWILLWADMTQSIQTRNREDSFFWWMTPYFFRMMIKTFFDWNTTFIFRSTGNIDRAVLEAKKEQTSGGRFKHVKAHMIYVVVVTATLIYRIHDAIKYKECRSVLIVLGLTLFHITLCAHMLVPIIFLAFPTSHFKSEHRKKLLSYDAYGVPKYSPATAAKPTWVSSMLIYEFLFYANLVFWFAVWYLARDLETTHQALLSVCKPETLPR
ncbi:unnamed protein product [Sphagnum compactum]